MISALVGLPRFRGHGVEQIWCG